MPSTEPQIPTLERAPAEDRAIRAIKTADAVDEAVARIYGAPFETDGVIHVVSAWRRDDGALVVLAIGDETPRAKHDAFALALARARADAIVTTGAILRAEPEMRHDYPGSVRMAAALARWRRQRGRERPPLSVVLTRSGELDFDHPLFADGSRALVYTTPETAARLRPLAPRGVGFLADARPSLRAAIARLQGQGLTSVVVEAGPSTARALYRPPVALDELLLSTYHAATLAPGLQAGVLADEATLAERLPRHSSPYPVATPDGEWRLSRHLAPTPTD